MSRVPPSGAEGLSNRAIFMSASVPAVDRAEKYRRVKDCHEVIDDAVVSLARAVLSNGGRLVFGGHPNISSFVAQVAAEYVRPGHVGAAAEGHPGASVDPPIIIYQSRAYEHVIPPATRLLEDLNCARIVWTEAKAGERFDPAVKNRPQCTKSLRHMRREMIRRSDPLAMVCIGGMEGVEEEARLFRDLEKKRPIYVIENSGGASYLLARRRWPELKVIDRRIIEERKELLRRKSPPSQAAGMGSGATVEYDSPGFSFLPNAIIMQELVAELMRRGGPVQ